MKLKFMGIKACVCERETVRETESVIDLIYIKQ